MATITPATAVQATPAAIAPVASTPAGDEITVSATQELFIVVDNGHASPITVTIPGVAATISRGAASGSFTADSITASVTNGTSKLFHISRDAITHYRNAQGRVAVNYTSGNAALTIQAIVA